MDTQPAFPCALCPGQFDTEIDRARHFAETHPISDPAELEALLARVRREHEHAP